MVRASWSGRNKEARNSLTRTNEKAKSEPKREGKENIKRKINARSWQSQTSLCVLCVQRWWTRCAILVESKEIILEIWLRVISSSTILIFSLPRIYVAIQSAARHDLATSRMSFREERSSSSSSIDTENKQNALIHSVPSEDMTEVFRFHWHVCIRFVNAFHSSVNEVEGFLINLRISNTIFLYPSNAVRKRLEN
jgi:hypothetical protein